MTLGLKKIFATSCYRVSCCVSQLLPPVVKASMTGSYRKSSSTAVCLCFEVPKPIPTGSVPHTQISLCLYFQTCNTSLNVYFGWDGDELISHKYFCSLTSNSSYISLDFVLNYSSKRHSSLSVVSWWTDSSNNFNTSWKILKTPPPPPTSAFVRKISFSFEDVSFSILGKLIRHRQQHTFVVVCHGCIKTTVTRFTP